MRKILTGTVDTDQKGKSNPVKVLQAYLDYGDTPKYFGDARAAELAVACAFALNAIRVCQELRLIEDLEGNDADPFNEEEEPNDVAR